MCWSNLSSLMFRDWFCLLQNFSNSNFFIFLWLSCVVLCRVQRWTSAKMVWLYIPSPLLGLNISLSLSEDILSLSLLQRLYKLWNTKSCCIEWVILILDLISFVYVLYVIVHILTSDLLVLNLYLLLWIKGWLVGFYLVFLLYFTWYQS